MQTNIKGKEEVIQWNIQLPLLGNFKKNCWNYLQWLLEKNQIVMNDKFEFVNLTQQTKSLLKQYGSNYRSR